MAYTQPPLNPATDDSILLLRRILRALEASSNADSLQRQRITIDSITSGLTLGTVTAVTAITNALPVGTNSIGNFGGYTNNDFQMMNQRIMYNTGIRSNIS
jgi:hypothetical protein